MHTYVLYTKRFLIKMGIPIRQGGREGMGRKGQFSFARTVKANLFLASGSLEPSFLLFLLASEVLLGSGSITYTYTCMRELTALGKGKPPIYRMKKVRTRMGDDRLTLSRRFQAIKGQHISTRVKAIIVLNC